MKIHRSEPGIPQLVEKSEQEKKRGQDKKLLQRKPRPAGLLKRDLGQGERREVHWVACKDPGLELQDRTRRSQPGSPDLHSVTRHSP